MHELRFSVVRYEDFDWEALVEVSNDSFTGKLEIVFPYTNCLKMLEELNGFPKNISDEVTFFSNSDFTYSSLALNFYCRDNVGNPSILVSMRAHQQEQSFKEEINQASIVHCDPQGIQNFCNQLRAVIGMKRDTASLGMI